jgi:hypothetical protein
MEHPRKLCALSNGTTSCPGKDEATLGLKVEIFLLTAKVNDSTIKLSTFTAKVDGFRSLSLSLSLSFSLFLPHLPSLPSSLPPILYRFDGAPQEDERPRLLPKCTASLKSSFNLS